MQTISKDNAKKHCLTCLVKLTEETVMQHYDNDEFSEDEIQEFKAISINIQTNEELQFLLRRYIDIDLIGREKELSHSICLKCYNKFQGFENFRQQAIKSVEQLVAIINKTNEAKAEEFVVDSKLEDGKLNEDVYKMLLKDTLMETESILLDNNGGPSLQTAEVHDPDPFGTTTTTSTSSSSLTFTPTPAAALCDVLHINTNSNFEASDNEKFNTCDWMETEAVDSSDLDDSNSVVMQKKSEVTPNMDSFKNGTETNPSSEESNRAQTKKRRLPKRHVDKLQRTQGITKKKDNKIKRRNKGTKNSFKCDQCNHSFAHKITLDAHVRKIHEGSKKPFQCDRCDKAYTFIGGLYTHIKEVHEVEVRSHACDHPGCDRIYTSFVAMQKHKRLKHSEIIEQKKYVCEQCGATFNQSGNLKHHRRTKHPTQEEQAEKEKEKTLYNCEICQKQFHSRYTLKYHTLQLHTDDMKYECNVCGRRMAKKFMLVQHMLVHSTDKMPCEHCGKQFIRKFELEAHIRAVHMKLKPYECQYCSECFASRKTLRHHEYIHTGEKPYVCDICGQAYRQQTCLKNHRKSHGKHNTDSDAVNVSTTL